jgi:hypothetical protein
MLRFFIDASNAANLKKALAQFPASLFNQARGALADAAVRVWKEDK